MTTFLDTSVAIALVNTKDKFHAWSIEQLQKLRADGPVLISDTVYAEWSVGMKTKEDVDAAVQAFGLQRYQYSDAALFRAGKAYALYKQKQGGPKSGVLPDFFIGALAEIENIPLATANPKDFVGYFSIKIIKP